MLHDVGILGAFLCIECFGKREVHRASECEIGECNPVSYQVGFILQVLVDGTYGTPLPCSDSIVDLESILVRTKLNRLSEPL